MAEKVDIVTVSYVLGILSIVFTFVSPVAGLILGLVGLSQSKKHRVAETKKLNIIGIVLSVIFLIISIIAIVYSVKSGASSFFPSI